MLTVVPLRDLGIVKPGDDLARLFGDAAVRQDIEFRDFDVLVIAQKIVSKQEGRYCDLRDIEPSPEALRLADITGKDPCIVELVLREASNVVRAAPGVLITRHRLGHVMANGGIDRSNIDGADAQVLLLPEDPDRSAHNIRSALAERFGVAPAIMISDSFGRPWRIGTTSVALGLAGIPAVIDMRGEADLSGRPLEATVVGFADAVAAAAGLVMGEGSQGVPAVLVRGLSWVGCPQCVSAILRPEHEDLFR